jgi:hypothetical protein
MSTYFVFLVCAVYGALVITLAGFAVFAYQLNDTSDLL